MAFLILGSTSTIAGAAETDEEAEEETVYLGWTPYTSEENPPISCDGGSAMTGVQCRGSYCDNIRVHCFPSGGVLSASSYWTPYFSEEDTNYRVCDPGHWITTISCRGSFCDSIALKCSKLDGISENSCYWTGWISEEGDGTLFFGDGYYARGVECNGSFCDNKRFYVCRT